MSNLSDGDASLKAPEDLITPLHTKLYCGDLSFTAESWSRTFISNLLDIKIACIPVVNAAAPDKPKIPNKPPPMKYTDLPISEINEFYEYQTYLADKQKCPGIEVKLLHSYLCPKVHTVRTTLAESFFGMTGELGAMKNEACEAACKNLQCFKKFMRHPDNLLIRRAVVVLGTLTGIYIGSGTRGICKKMFFGTLGALAAGALCFPKETDVIVRNTSYNVAKLLIVLYNSTCGKNFALRERIPCSDDLPPPPPPRQAHEINKKCEDVKARAEAKAKEAAKRAAAKAEALAREAICKEMGKK